jgi:hypothetical protein
MPHSREAAVCLGFNDIDFIDEVANICHSLSWALDVLTHKAAESRNYFAYHLGIDIGTVQILTMHDLSAQ